jgi:purine-nucleoside phosphorylase
MKATPQASAARLKKLSSLRPALALVLGSGFHPVLSELEVDAQIAYEKLPGFPPTDVEGHAGTVFLGHLAGTPALILNGRAHFYEGCSLERVTFPVRALAAFGIRDLLLTNAAGGIHSDFRPGDFMVCTDHINFMGANPLRGEAIPGLSRFTDLTNTYDKDLAAMLRRAARRCGIRIHSGVYLALSGPSYETPAEIRAFARLGADAVGMSTVPEAIVARQCGLKVAALSCITNLAAGLGGGQLSHSETLKSANRVRVLATQMLRNFAVTYGRRH